MKEDMRTLEQKSLHLLTAIAETMDTDLFSHDDVQKYLSTVQPQFKECLTWLKDNKFLRLQFGIFGSYQLTPDGELFIRKLMAA